MKLNNNYLYPFIWIFHFHFYCYYTEHNYLCIYTLIHMWNNFVRQIPKMGNAGSAHFQFWESLPNCPQKVFMNPHNKVIILSTVKKNVLKNESLSFLPNRWWKPVSHCFCFYRIYVFFSIWIFNSSSIQKFLYLYILWS